MTKSSFKHAKVLAFLFFWQSSCGINLNNIVPLSNIGDCSVVLPTFTFLDSFIGQGQRILMAIGSPLPIQRGSSIICFRLQTKLNIIKAYFAWRLCIKYTSQPLLVNKFCDHCILRFRHQTHHSKQNYVYLQMALAFLTMLYDTKCVWSPNTFFKWHKAHCNH